MSNPFLNMPRNIYLLGICQVIGLSAITMVVLIGGLIGSDMSPSPNLATLPSSLMIVGLAATTIPAAMLMRKIGRKKGFIISTIFASLAAILAAYAISENNFNLFCLAIFCLGTNGAFVQQYRFAAIEIVPKELASKAVSLILFAGILAGFLGPEIAKRTKDLFSLPPYVGSFIILAVLLSIVAIILLLLKENKAKEEGSTEKERPFRVILNNPIFLLAALSGSVGYGIMSFIMTATPIHLHKISHMSLEYTAFVIQSHIVAMFLPSLATGILITRFGILRILIGGLLSFCIAVIFAISADTLFFYWIALVFLGIGWNFLYISSTVLLPHSYKLTERFKAQGVNDFMVMGSQMIVSFFAGSLLFSAGWKVLNLLTLPLIIGTIAIFFFYRKQLLLPR